jgi:predicted GNAT family N-acyltransferase
VSATAAVPDPKAPCAVLKIGAWDELSEDAKRVRLAVFVREQGIDPALELDDRDAVCVHAVAYDAAGEPIGTGRLLPDAHVGRMAVLPAMRAKGIGVALLRALMAVARDRGDREVRLHAQTSAIGFYLREGFACVGSPYEEAGIPHQTMSRRLDAP